MPLVQVARQPVPPPAHEQALEPLAPPAAQPASAADGAADGGGGEDEDLDELVTVIGDGEQEFTLGIRVRPAAGEPPSPDLQVELDWFGREVAVHTEAMLHLRSSPAELRSFFINLIPPRLNLYLQTSPGKTSEPVPAGYADLGMGRLATSLAAAAAAAGGGLSAGMKPVQLSLDEPVVAQSNSISVPAVLRIELTLSPADPPTEDLSAAGPYGAGQEDVLALAMVVDTVAIFNAATAELGDLVPDQTELVLAVSCPGQPSVKFGESWLTAAIPIDNPYCSCELTRVRQGRRSLCGPSPSPRPGWRTGSSCRCPGCSRGTS